MASATSVKEPTLGKESSLKVNVEEIKGRRGPAPWNERIVVNDRYVVTVICQNPGTKNDWHYHLTDEYWYIYEGDLSWTIEGQVEPIHVKAGDFILAPGNCFHLIKVHGDKQAIRIATTYEGEWHRHERENKPPAPEGARPD
jgi:quercetin dioxygenase-like cupin family protein